MKVRRTDAQEIRLWNPIDLPSPESLVFLNESKGVLSMH